MSVVTCLEKTKEESTDLLMGRRSTKLFFLVYKSLILLVFVSLLLNLIFSKEHPIENNDGSQPQASDETAGPGSPGYRLPDIDQEVKIDPFPDRAYRGAPPVVPHSFRDERDNGEKCFGCHALENNIAKRHRAIRPVPHTEMINCQQCHVNGSQKDIPPFRENNFQGLGPVSHGIRVHAKAPPTIPHNTFMRSECISCHSIKGHRRFSTDHEGLNDCRQCHIQHGEAQSLVGRDLCLRCHVIEQILPFQHEPFLKECSKCHKIQAPNEPLVLVGGTRAEACASCHPDVGKDLPNLLPPVALGECLACHAPHQSRYKGLLIDDPAVLCMVCHVDMQQQIDEAISVHDPVRRDCLRCHGAHGGDSEAFLLGAEEKMCADCHQVIFETRAKLKYQHTAIKDGKGCNLCHDAHFSNQEKLLRSHVIDLCLSCHDQPVQKGDVQLAAIGDQLRNSKFLHGPLRQGNCTGCHDAHGSDHSRILREDFPEGFYAPFTKETYALCFRCHDSSIFMSPTSDITGFRNGEYNLHYLHVHQEKGRSCRTCHHEHASNQPKHIRDSVRFGNWDMKIVFNKTDTGGGCQSGCHAPYGHNYDRENPYELKTEKESQ